MSDPGAAGDDQPYSMRVYRLGLSRQLRAEIIRAGAVIARAEITGEGPPAEAVAVARQWAAALGYPTPEPPPTPAPRYYRGGSSDG